MNRERRMDKKEWIELELLWSSQSNDCFCNRPSQRANIFVIVPVKSHNTVFVIVPVKRVKQLFCNRPSQILHCPSNLLWVDDHLRLGWEASTKHDSKRFALFVRTTSTAQVLESIYVWVPHPQKDGKKATGNKRKLSRSNFFHVSKLKCEPEIDLTIWYHNRKKRA